MSIETAKKAVDFLYGNLKRKREVCKDNSIKGNINFFGGEPMLLFNEIIVPLILYTKEKYPNDFTFGITTNGTLLTEESIKFFYDNQVHILLSIDGNKETQDYNRPCKNNNQSSFDMIESIFPILLDYFPNTCFRMTIYEDTCDKLFDNILFAQQAGFQNIFFCIDSRHNFSEESHLKLRIELEKIFLYFTGSLINGFEFPNIKPLTEALKMVL
jgi:sulfatase maturation enzyme AslB (radical SAM superfamily)